MGEINKIRVGKNVAGMLVLALAMAALLLAFSYAWADNADANVAKIDDTEYATLSAAVSAAEDGDTITLIADTSVSSQIKITGKSITLDLNGCTLTLGSESNAARMLYVSSGASLTVTDSGSGGTITNDGYYSYGLIDVYGTLVIKGGTFYDSGSGDGASIKGRDGSSITISGGTFTVAYTNYNGATESDSGEVTYSGNTNYFGNYILRSTYGYVSITGGSFTAGQNCWGAICLEYCESASSDSDIVSVSGVEVTCTASAGIYLYGTDAVISDSTVAVNGARTTDYLFITSAIAASNGAEVTIESGTYSAPYAVYVWSSGGIITIEDGDFTGTLAVLKADAVNAAYYGEGESSIIVYDGTFDGEILIQTNASSYIDATLTIYHGDFTSEDAADYVVSTYTNDDGETVYTALTEETDEENGTTYQLVHALVAVDATEETCTEDGNVAYYTCSYEDCDSCFLYDEETAAYVEADYDSEIAIAATGHTADEAVIENEVAATCTETGSYDTVVYCAVCGTEISRETMPIEATGHDYVVTKSVAATCTATGSRTYVCNNDSTHTYTETIAALGHDYDFTNITWEWASDLSTATAAVACTNDTTHVLTATATATSEVTTAATCTTEGVETYTATVSFNGYDGEYATTTTAVVAVDEDAHTWGEGVVTEPTCTEDGYTTYTCTECGATKTETGDAAIGHSWQISWGDWYESDDGWTCTATLTCKNDATHVLSGTVSVTSKTSEDATGYSEGATVYTATATFDGVDGTYTNDVTKTVEGTDDTSTDTTDDIVDSTDGGTTDTDATDNTDGADGGTTGTGTTGDATDDTDNGADDTTDSTEDGTGNADTTDNTVGSTDDSADADTADDATSATDNNTTNDTASTADNVIDDTDTTDDDNGEDTDTDATVANSENTEGTDTTASSEDSEDTEDTDATLVDTSDAAAPLAADAAGVILLAIAAGAVALRRRVA